ncbi:OCIA domain-containing protein 1-like [Gigantopelta aegis]|uniref:OCIA domain-containing protein 1-like n=1 Tax=Gigantopelta aegis TaxID=1735272 RepID=UPI001B88CFC8|nr:OCIA domain-containing protein 1-like [Gigantopelta aegis]
MASSKEFSAPNPGGEHDVRRAAPKLSSEEMLILKECNWESLMYRCIPLGVVFMGTTQFLVKIGYLSGHPKYGSLFKNMGALFIGYLAGKLSYQSTCREKILTRIPNSRLAQALSGKKNPELLQSDYSSVSEAYADDAYVRQKREQNYDIDTNRSSSEISKGLDDNFRPTIDREVRNKQVDEDQSFKLTSYDELRRQNRQEYEKSSSLPGPLEPVPRRRPEQSPWLSTQKATKKNQYGDEWDE